MHTNSSQPCCSHDHNIQGAFHSHTDDHHHLHGGHHHPQIFDRAFFLGITLNLIFVGVEITYGVMSNALALIADAGHNLSDVLSLALAWGAIWLARRKPSQHRTYGYGRSTILASLVNALLLMTAAGAIGWEAIGRLFDPTAVTSTTIIWVATLGILINTGTALLFLRGQHHDINVRGAYLHMLADAAVSCGVVLGGVLISLTGWQWIDPVLSLIIVGVIVVGTFGLLKESINLAIDAVPRLVNPEEVRAYLLSCEGVMTLHDLHIWALSTTSTALTVHIIRASDTNHDDWLNQVAHDLQERFGIDHPTIQIENQNGHATCKLAAGHIS